MFKVTPNPPDTDPVSPYESPDSKKLHDAAERALDHHFPPAEKKRPKRKGQLFSAIAADLADHVQGSSRSVALALSRMADGVHLLVDKALDHLDEPEMAAVVAKQQTRVT